MKKLILFAALTLVAACNPAPRVAHAGEGRSIHIHLMPSVPVWEQPSALILQVPQPTTDNGITEQNDRIEAWEKRCEPKIVIDRYGVNRYTYNGKAGCAFGRFTD